MPSLTAVILAGGEGTRLRPLTNDLPKPVLPVANRPFFEYMLHHLRAGGVEHVIMALGYHADPLIQRFGDGSAYGMLIDYVVETEPLGTSGAVRALLPELKETFLVLNGDCLSTVDISAMVEQHVERREYATLAIHEVDDPSRYGVVVTDGIGYVSRFAEKPPGPRFPAKTVNTGVYVLEPEMFRFIEGGFSMFERDLFPGALMTGVEIGTFPWDGYFMDMGTPESYLQLNRDVISGIAPPGPGTLQPVAPPEIDATAVIEGPVVYGEGVRIGADVRITGPVALGDGCVIEQGASLEDSVLWEGVRIGAGSRIRGAVLGHGVDVGEGAEIGQGGVYGSGESAPAGLRADDA